jgi:hypothetical protein
MSDIHGHHTEYGGGLRDQRTGHDGSPQQRESTGRVGGVVIRLNRAPWRAILVQRWADRYSNVGIVALPDNTIVGQRTLPLTGSAWHSTVANSMVPSGRDRAQAVRVPRVRHENRLAANLLIGTTAACNTENVVRYMRQINL